MAARTALGGIGGSRPGPLPGTTWTFVLAATCSPRAHPCGSFLTVLEKRRLSLQSVRDAALGLLNEAIEAAREVGMPWEGVIELSPSAELTELVRRSQELASEGGSGQD